jgi:hypothetical protein
LEELSRRRARVSAQDGGEDVTSTIVMCGRSQNLYELFGDGLGVSINLAQRLS